MDISQPADYFIACYTVLMRPNKVETAVAIVGLQFGLYHVVAPLSFLRSINLASLFVTLYFWLIRSFTRSCVHRQHFCLRSFTSSCFPKFELQSSRFSHAHLESMGKIVWYPELVVTSCVVTSNPETPSSFFPFYFPLTTEKIRKNSAIHYKCMITQLRR